MAIDIYHTRRKMPHRCEYWRVDNSYSKDKSILIHEKKPSGVFWAMERNSMSSDQQRVAGVFMHDRDNVQLYTQDDIFDIKANDIVRFRGDVWMVADVQREPHRKESWNSKHPCYAYYISLRK